MWLIAPCHVASGKHASVFDLGEEGAPITNIVIHGTLSFGTLLLLARRALVQTVPNTGTTFSFVLILDR